MRYIVITGGVVSGIGKGLVSSTLGLMFQSMGYTVTMIKIDPYLNIDAGSMSPYEHGECFVLSDGGETDLDLGNYERHIGIELTRDHNITTGKIYQNVIEKERRGDYLGATVQVVPHITDTIIQFINRASHHPIKGQIPNLCLIEVGGTVGDIENIPFMEALQQMKTLHEEDVFCFVHVGMAISNPEIKTKPIQHSISTLRYRGIFPDILVIRSKEPISSEIKIKLQRLCQIKAEDIISNPNVKTIYHLPSVFREQRICDRIGMKLKLDTRPIPDIYSDILHYYEAEYPRVKLGIVGKYMGSPDTYLSLNRAIEHAGFKLNLKIDIDWIDSCNLVDLSLYQGFIIPGGFGSRGIKGKLEVATYARNNKIPLLGICLGMQIMVVESFNTLSKIKGTSTEWTEESIGILPVIDILPDQTEIKGGTMRLGNYETILAGKMIDLYGSTTAIERHRHRYEVNAAYVDTIIESGLNVVGISKQGLVEIVQLKDHPFYVGCQFHPEYISCVTKPHPLFMGLFNAMRE